MDEISSRPDRRGRVGVLRAHSFNRSLALTALLMGVVLAAAVILAGCGGSDDGASAATTSGDQAGADAATVKMTDMTFDPQTITVAAGTTITWVNEDSVSHNAVADDESWGTDIFGEGGSASIAFDTPGTYTYNCTLHAGMVGTVVVE